MRSGQVLTLQPPVQDSRAYLTVSGGIDVPVVMDSRSTDLKANFGGYQGRALRKGDSFRFCPLPAQSRQKHPAQSTTLASSLRPALYRPIS